MTKRLPDYLLVKYSGWSIARHTKEYQSNGGSICWSVDVYRTVKNVKFNKV